MSMYYAESDEPVWGDDNDDDDDDDDDDGLDEYCIECGIALDRDEYEYCESCWEEFLDP